MRLKAILTPGESARPGAVAGVAAIAAVLTLAVGAGSIAMAVQAAPQKARNSQWIQRIQEDSFSPKGEVRVAADRMVVHPDGVAIWTGRPVVELKSATGDRTKDAELAKVRFLVDGRPAPRGFDPESIDSRKISFIKVTRDGEGPSVINIVMAPAPPPPAPPVPPAPEVAPVAPVAPTPPTPPTAAGLAAPPAPPAFPAAGAIPPPPAPPAPPAPPRPIVSGADWKSRPTAADVAAVYPARARAQGLSGHVVLTCDTDSEGWLSNCRTLGENPADNGFAEAALKLAPKFRVNAVYPDGRKPGRGTVTIPLRFEPPEVVEARRAAARAREAERRAAEADRIARRNADAAERAAQREAAEADRTARLSERGGM